MLETDDEPPFAQAEKHDAIQPALWDNPAAAAPKQVKSLNDGEKSGVFGKLIRSLRTTRKNAVLFTLCMDLGNFFEGEKLILTTDSEAVFKGLTRPDNANFIAETLAELGVTDHEVRLVEKGESDYEKALKELKSNFEGTEIQIKNQ